MSSIGGILSIARTAIYANQTAVQVASHNISNAQTEGYSRQRVSLSTNTPLRMPNMVLGTGVVATDVARVRDGYLDLAVRRENANAAGFGVRRDLLLQVESVFSEPSEHGLAATLDAFWSSWSDLANDPGSSSARSLVRQRGEQVATTLNGYDRSLTDLENTTVVRLEAQVAELNSLFRQVAELNERIFSAEVGGRTAGDLRDARDLAIDRASRLADVRVIPRSNGSIALAIGSTNVVDGNDTRTLQLSLTRGANGIVESARIHASGVTLDPGSALSGTLDGLADIRATRNQLDALARMLVREVNSIHGAPPHDRDFFNDPPGGVTAGSIRLSDAIRASAANVLAGVDGTDNSIALDLASMRDRALGIIDESGSPVLDSDGVQIEQSLGGYYRDLVTGVAFRASDAERSASAASTLAEMATRRRDSVSSVSVDEELMSLMQHQQAYVAASKIVTTADEMLQSLLNMV